MSNKHPFITDRTPTPLERILDEESWMEGVVQEDLSILWGECRRYRVPHNIAECLRPGMEVQFIPRLQKWRGENWAMRVWPKGKLKVNPDGTVENIP